MAISPGEGQPGSLALVSLPQEQGPIAAIVPHPARPCMTIEMSSQVYRGGIFCMSRICHNIDY